MLLPPDQPSSPGTVQAVAAGMAMAVITALLPDIEKALHRAVEANVRGGGCGRDIVCSRGVDIIPDLLLLQCDLDDILLHLDALGASKYQIALNNIQTLGNLRIASPLQPQRLRGERSKTQCIVVDLIDNRGKDGAGAFTGTACSSARRF